MSASYQAIETMSNRAVTYGGAALLAGVGYYFYQAGGDPKVAQKKAEGL